MTPAFPCPVQTQARLRPGALALACEGQRWTWAELDARVGAAAARHRAAGTGPGVAVALLAENAPAVVVHHVALARLGATALVLNPRLTAHELAAQLRTLTPRRVLAEAALLDQVPGAEPLALPEAARACEGPAEVPASACSVLFTSGTTGRSRAAVLPWTSFRAAALASREVLGTGPSSRWACAVPLFHVAGLSMLWRAALDGSALLLFRRFDAPALLGALAHDGVSHVSLVATTLQRLLDAVPAPVRAPALEAVLVGGGPVPPALLERARSAGLPARLTWGLTEACAQVCTQRAPSGDDCGPPLPGCQVQVVDPTTRAPRGPGEDGELLVRSSALFAGYAGDPEATRAALRGGWLATGDLGCVDARGHVRVRGRRTDLLVRGGENVYPAEVEAALLEHPRVAEVAVAAREDPAWGEVPVAFYVARGEPPDVRALEDFCRGRLAGFKVPAHFVRVPGLPRTALGKPDRAALRALAGAPSFSAAPHPAVPSPRSHP